MQDRQGQKTSWSILSNIISNLSPKKIFIFCLLASANSLSNVNASEREPLNFMKSNRYLGTANKQSCIQAAPDCLLTITPIEEEKFDVTQVCNDIQDVSLVDQMRSQNFQGQTLCEGVVTSGNILQDGSVRVSTIDFNTSGNSYKAYQRFFVPQKSKETATAKQESPQPTTAKQECPEPVKCQPTPECRIELWSVSGYGRGPKTPDNEFGLKYQLMGTSNDKVTDYSHICKIVRN